MHHSYRVHSIHNSNENDSILQKNQRERLMVKCFDLPIVRKQSRQCSPALPCLKGKILPCFDESQVDIIDQLNTYQVRNQDSISRNYHHQKPSNSLITEQSPISQTIQIRLDARQLLCNDPYGKKDFNKQKIQFDPSNRQSRWKTEQATDSLKRISCTISPDCFIEKESYTESPQQKTIFSKCKQEMTPVSRNICPQMVNSLRYKPQMFFPTIPKIILHRKLKIILLFVKAVIRLSKKLRIKSFQLVKTKQQKEYEELQKMKKSHQDYIDYFGLKNVQGQQKKFVHIVANKILHYFEERKYILECNKLQDYQNSLGKDLKRIRYCGLSLMFLQNLEMFTRSENLPLLIKHQINLSLFKSKTSIISQFVAKRTSLFSKKVTNLPQNQKTLIAVEFLLFSIIVPNLIQLVNDMQTQSIVHKNQTLIYCIGVLSLIQRLFLDYFRNLKEKACINIKKPVQKIINISLNESSGLLNGKIDFTNKITENGEPLQILCFRNETVDEVFQEKKSWELKIEKLFNQIILNLVGNITI